MDNSELIKIAQSMLEKAYAPYSKHYVGAALLGKNGKVYTGCNIESASFGATICAERCAISTAVADGCREISKLAVATTGPGYCSPCGICRQLIYEFGPDTIILCAKTPEDYKELTISQLLPMGFGASDM